MKMLLDLFLDVFIDKPILTPSYKFAYLIVEQGKTTYHWWKTCKASWVEDGKYHALKSNWK